MMPKGCPVIPGGSARGVRCGASQGGGASSYRSYSGVPTMRRGAVAVVARPPGITGQPLARSGDAGLLAMSRLRHVPPAPPIIGDTAPAVTGFCAAPHEQLPCIHGKVPNG